MRKALKIFGLGIAILFAIGIILGNIGNIILSKRTIPTANSIDEWIMGINSHLPIKELDGCNFFTITRVFQENNNIIWEATLDTTFFHPIHDSFLPESLNGGILPEGNRDTQLDLDTLLTREVLRQSHRLNLLHYHIFVKGDKPNPFYNEIMKHKLSLIWRTYSPFSNANCNYAMSYHDLKDIEKFCITQPQAAINSYMSEYIKRQNLLLTLASSNSDISMQMANEETALVFRCTYDKSHSADGNNPITNLRNVENELKIALNADFKNLPIFFDADKICNKTQKEFSFVLTDYNKTDSIKITTYKPLLNLN